MIEQYEKREDKESKFVYALDKIEPILHLYTSGGKTWREKKITIEMLIENKENKIREYPKLTKCFDDLIEILRKEEDRLFNT